MCQVSITPIAGSTHTSLDKKLRFEIISTSFTERTKPRQKIRESVLLKYKKPGKVSRAPTEEQYSQKYLKQRVIGVSQTISRAVEPRKTIQQKAWRERSSKCYKNKVLQINLCRFQNSSYRPSSYGKMIMILCPSNIYKKLQTTFKHISFVLV